MEEKRIGMTITNKVTLVSGGSYGVIGSWHKERGKYVARLRNKLLGLDCVVEGTSIEDVKKKVLDIVH